MYLLMAIIAVVVSFSVAGAWFIDRDTVDSTMDMGGAVVVKLVGTGEDGTIQNFKQLYDSDGGAYPGDKILDSIKVQMGEKTEESVLRVQYSVDILDKEKNVKTQDLTEAETKLATLLKNDLRAKTTLFSSDWSQTTSDWIYYKHLASGKTKPIDLFDEYSLPLPDSEMDNQYQELSFRISLVAEAIQAANIMSHNEWNDDITNLSDSALMERVIKYNGERFAEVDEVLPYIETTGGQYIDTGYVANLNTAVEVTFQTNTVNKWLFGSRTSGGASNTYAVHVSSMNSIWFQMANDSSSTQFSVSNFANKQSTITVNKDAAYLNGAQIGTVGRTAFGDNSLSLYLGVINANGSGTDRPFVGKIYSMRIWDNGELVRFFVPARDKDGNIGFYDLVTHQMFLNAGSGNFAYGHSINYIANGGTIAANAPKTFVLGDLPIALPVPTRAGYEFGGWFLSSDFSGAAQTTIPAGTNNNVYVYAKWIKTYNITYHLGGGINAEDNTTEFNERTLPLTLKAPTRDGFTFGGWYQNPAYSGNQVTTIDAGTEKNVSLWAKWNAIEYSVSYVLNDGTNSDQNVAKYSILDTPVKLYNPTRDGYLFEGWFASSDFSGERMTYLSKDSLGDVTLHAKWSLAYTITYNTNGGFNDGRNPSVFTENTETFTLFEAEKVNYSFLGWFDNEELTGTPITQIAKGTKNNIVLWAKWSSTQITVTFNPNGGGVSPLTKVVKKGGTYGELPTPTRAGYAFDGWFVIPDEYQRVEYIENSGTQYINTGYYWTSDNVRAVLSANVTTHNQGESLFGNEEYIGGDRYFALIPHNSGGTMKIFSLDRFLIEFTYPLSTDMILDVSASTKGSDKYVNLAITSNGSTKNYGGKATTGGSVITNPNNLKTGVGEIYLFANHNSGPGAVTGGTPDMSARQIIRKMKVYSFKMYDNNILVRDFVPVVRKSDGVAGMYDMVESKFYTNAGSGAFIAGEASERITADTPIVQDFDHTLFAQWTENVYTVTYNLDGGTNAAGNPATFKCSNLPIALLDATKNGEYFAGWYLDAEFTKRVTKIDAGSLKNIELWARFSQSPLVFDLVGSSAYSVRAANTSISGDIDIPQTYNGKPVVVIQNSAFKDCSNVTSILIPSSIKSIGINAFENCSNITETTIPEGVTLIGNNTFLGCEKLASVTLPTSLENIGANAFAGCTSLTSIVLPKNIQEIGANAFGETSKYGNKIEMTEEFWNAGHYQSRTSHEFGTGANIGGQSETYVKINGYQTNSDTAWYVVMKNAVPVVGGKDYIVSFYIRAENCLETINLINRDGGHNSRFIWSTGETSLPYSVNFANDGNWHKVEFRIVSPAGATTLKVRIGMDSPNTYGIGSYVEIADFKISGPQTLDVVEVFGDTPATLKNNVFPNSVSKIYVKPSLVATYKTAWAEYKDKIVGFTEYSITYNLNGGTNSTKNISSFTKIDVPIKLYDPTKENADFLGWYATSDFSGEKVTEITTASNVTLYARWDRKMTITYVLNGGINSSANLSTITESMLPYSLMPASKQGYAFVGWFIDEGLSAQTTAISAFGDITIYAAWEWVDPNLVFTLNSDGTAYSVKAKSTNISGQISIPSTFKGKPVNEIEAYAFENCSKITDIFFTSSIQTIASSAFYNTEIITYTNASSGANICEVKGLPVTSGSWKYAEKLDNSLIIIKYLGNSSTVSIPNLINEKIVKNIYSNCFSSKDKIQSITIPNSVISIGSGAFSGCNGLTKVNITDLAAWFKITFDNEYANPLNYAHHLYLNNTELTEITIPNSITKINKYALCGASAITSITIPTSVTSIKYYAFSNCSAIQRIFIPRNVTEIENYSFNMWMKSAVIYCEVDSKPNGWDSDWNKYGQFTVTVVWGASGTPLIEFGWEYIENSSGTITILAYRGSEKELATPKTLANKTVSRINGYCFSDKKSITSVIISDGVEYIGERAFYQCTSLQKVYISKSVQTIYVPSQSEPVFDGCNSDAVLYCGASSKPSGWGTYWNYYNYSNQLTTIWDMPSLPQQNSEWEYVEKSDGTIKVFKYLGSSTNVMISKINNKEVSEVYNGCFQYKSNIISVTIPNSVISIGESVFNGCTSLENLTIPFVGHSSTSTGSEGVLGYIFGYTTQTANSGYSSSSSSFTTLTTGSVANAVCSWTDTTYSYRVKTGGSLLFPKYTTYYGLRSYWYYIPSSLKNVTVTGGNINTAAFCRVPNIKVTLNGVATIGTYAFYNGTPTSITMSESVTKIEENAFSGCSGLTRVNISDLDAWFKISFSGSSASNPLYYAHHLYLNNTELTEITIPSSITKINANVLAGASAITSVTIPDGVTSIESSAFLGCSGLTSITIPSSVKNIGNNAFSGCSGLTSINIPNGVTSIGSSTFYNCSNLTSITIPDSVTSIGSHAFYNCSALTSITIPSRVTSIGISVFSGCNALATLTIPFVGGSSSSNTYLGYIFGTSSYSNNSSYVPSSLKTVVVTNSSSIPSYAFYGCSGLTSITIPNSVTSIGVYAFYGCSGLTSITIPSSVTSIGYDAFENCTAMTKIYIPSSVTTISASSYSYSPFYGWNSTAIIYCGASSKPSGWGAYWNYYASGKTLAVNWGASGLPES